MKTMKTSSLAMTVGITPFVIQIRVALAVVHNLSMMMKMMIGTTHQLLLPVAQAHLHRGVLAAHLPVDLVEAQAVHQEVHPGVPGAHLEAHLVGQVVHLPVVVQEAVLRVEVQEAALRRRNVVLQTDYNTIQTPSPASKIPIVSSTLRAFSWMKTINGVPEIISATKTYQPPSIHIAIQATKARSPHVKSG